MKARNVVIAVLLLVVAGGHVWAQKEGQNVGKVITTGEDRVVVGLHNGQQMTFEVRTVPDGDTRIADAAQVAQIKSLKTDQSVFVKWVQAHDGHYYITEMRLGPEDGANHGLVRGEIITADEARIVVANDAGGQITLEVTGIRRRNNFIKDPFQELVAGDLKAGDRVTAMWQLGDGMHYILRGIATDDPSDDALASVFLQAQLRESYNQINQLQNEMNQLKNLINKLLKQLQPQDQ